MLKSLTYQQKLKWLGIVAILSFVIVYTLAVKKTFEEKSTCEEKQKTLEFSKDLDNKLAQIKNKTKQNGLSNISIPLCFYYRIKIFLFVKFSY